MGVVDLKEPKAFEPHHVLGGQGPLEIRVVHVDQHGLVRLLLLGQDGIDIVLQDLGHRRTALWRNQFDQVDRIEMGLVGDLLGLDQEETSGLLEEATDFRQRLEPDFGLALLVRSRLDPFVCEPGDVLIEGGPPGVRDRHPAVTLRQDVVIRQRQEVIAVFFVPLHHQFGEIISVAPERVAVQIALPPARSGLFAGKRSLACDHEDQQERPENDSLR